MHAAGYLGSSDGSLSSRGSGGNCWSSMQLDATFGWYLLFYNGACYMYNDNKARGQSARCLRDY